MKKYKIYTTDRRDFRRVLKILLENGFVFTFHRFKTIEECELKYETISGVPFTGKASELGRWHWILIGFSSECSRLLEPCVPDWPLRGYETITLNEFLKIKDNY